MQFDQAVRFQMYTLMYGCMLLCAEPPPVLLRLMVCECEPEDDVEPDHELLALKFIGVPLHQLVPVKPPPHLSEPFENAPELVYVPDPSERK